MTHPYTEKQAVAALKRVAKRWPNDLWLFSASGRLHVMRKHPDGSRAIPGADDNGMDPSLRIDSINIENDGGDW